MNAELTYLFRHVLLRDAAYQLQLPADLARLHVLALQIVEEVCVRKGDIASLNEYSAELAHHAGRARELGGEDAPFIKQASELEVKFLGRAIIYAYARFQPEVAFPMIDRYVNLAATPSRQRVAILMRGCDMALDLAQYDRALELGQRARNLAETEKPDIRGGAARLYGISLHRLGRLQEAETVFRLTLQMCRSERDVVGVGRSLERLGMLLVEKKNLTDAEPCFLEALEIYKSSGDMVAWGATRSNYAHVLRAHGRLAEAIEVAQEALARHRQFQQLRFEGVTLGMLSRFQLEAGNRQLSAALFEQAVEIDERTRNHDALITLFGDYAALHRKSGELERASELLARALKIHDACGNRQAMFNTLVEIAGIKQELGRSEDEWNTLLRAQSLARDLGPSNAKAQAENRLRELTAQRAPG
jgi:tetratricopeptide (TPR) repeat protein